MSKPNSPSKQNGNVPVVCDADYKMDDRNNQKVTKMAKKNGDSLVCLWSHDKSERSAKTTPKICEYCEKKTKKDIGDDGEAHEIKIDTIFERTTHKKGPKMKKTEMVPTKPPKPDVFDLQNFPENTPKTHLTETKPRKGVHKKREKTDAIKISASATNLTQIKTQYQTATKKKSHKSSKKHKKIDDHELICYYKNESNLASDSSSKNANFGDDCSYQTPKIVCKCFVDDTSELHIKKSTEIGSCNKLIDVEVINTKFGTSSKISEEYVVCKNTPKLKSLIPKPIENLDYKIECCLKRFPKLYQNQDLCGFNVDLHQGSFSDVPNTSEGDLCGLDTTFWGETSEETSTDDLASTSHHQSPKGRTSIAYQSCKNLVGQNPKYQPLKELYERKYGSISTIKEQIESVNEEISNMIKTALFKIDTKSNYCCLNVDFSDTTDDERDDAKTVPNFRPHQNSQLHQKHSTSTLKRKSTEDVAVPKKKFKEDSPIFRLLENALEEYQKQERTKTERNENTCENTMVRQMFSMLSHMEVLLEEYFHGNFGGYAHTSFVCSCDKRFTCDKSSQTAIAERFKPKSRYTIQTYTVFCSTLTSAETQTLNTKQQNLVEAKSSIFGRLKKKLVPKNKSNQTLIEDTTKFEMVDNETQTDTKSGKFFGKIRTAVKFLSKKHSKSRHLEDTKNDPKMLSPAPSTSGSIFNSNKITQTYVETDTNNEEGFAKTADLNGDTTKNRTKIHGYKKDSFDSSDSQQLNHFESKGKWLSPKTSSLGVLPENTNVIEPYQKFNPEPALKHLEKPPKKFSKTKKNVKKGKMSKGDGAKNNQTANEMEKETIEGDIGRFDEESLDYTIKENFELKQLKMKKLLEKVHDMDKYYYKIAVPKVGDDDDDDKIVEPKKIDDTIELSLDNVNLEEFDLEFSGKKTVCCDVDKTCTTKSACTSTCVNHKDVSVEAFVDTHDVGTQPTKAPPKRDNFTQFKSCTTKCIDATHRSSLDLVPSLNSDAKKKNAPQKKQVQDFLFQNRLTVPKQNERTPLFRLRLDSNTKIEKGTKISIPSDESKNKFNCFNFDACAFVNNQSSVLEEKRQLTHITAHNCSIPNTQSKVVPKQPEEKFSNYYIIYMPEKLSEKNLNKNSAADFKIWYYFENMSKSIPEMKSTTTLPNSTTTTTTSDTTSSSIFQKILLLKKRSDTCQSDDDDGLNEGRSDGYKMSSNTSLGGVNEKTKQKRIVDVQYVTVPMVVSDGESIYRERARTSQNCF